MKKQLVTDKPFLKNALYGVSALFIHAGLLKSASTMIYPGADLTLVSAVLLSLLVIYSFIKTNTNEGGRRILVILSFIAIIIPGILLSPQSEYGYQKSLYFITLGTLSFAAGLESAQWERGLYLCIKWSAFFSLLIVLDSIQKMLSQGGGLDRLTAFGGTTIALGRDAGFLFVFCGTSYFNESETPFSKNFYLLTAILAAIIAVMTGSKGPIITALIALLFTVKNKINSSNYIRILCFGIVLIGSLVIAWQFVPSGSTDRLQRFSNAEIGAGDQERWKAITTAILLSAQRPLGLGWGGFQGYIPSWTGALRQYPHNLIVEFFVEGGWIAGIGIIWLLINARARAKKFLQERHYSVWAAFMIYTLSNAMVSGDVNDNRMVYVIMGLGLGFCAFPYFQEKFLGNQSRANF